MYIRDASGKIIYTSPQASVGTAPNPQANQGWFSKAWNSTPGKVVQGGLGILNKVSNIAQSALVGTFGAPVSLFQAGLEKIAPNKFNYSTNPNENLKNFTGFQREVMGKGLSTTLENRGMISKSSDAGLFSKAGFASNARNLVIDLLTDPTTYITFGVGGGTELFTTGGKAIKLNGVGTKVLKNLSDDLMTKSAMEGGKLVTTDGKLLKAIKPIKNLTPELANKTALQKMAATLEKNPDLFEKWVDKGGIKFGGATLVPGKYSTEIAGAPFRAIGDKLKPLFGGREGMVLNDYLRQSATHNLYDRPQGIAGNIIDSFDKVTKSINPQEAEEISLAITKDSIKKLPAKLRPVALEAKKIFDHYGPLLQKEGVITGMLERYVPVMFGKMSEAEKTIVNTYKNVKTSFNASSKHREVFQDLAHALALFEKKVITHKPETDIRKLVALYVNASEKSLGEKAFFKDVADMGLDATVAGTKGIKFKGSAVPPVTGKATEGRIFIGNPAAERNLLPPVGNIKDFRVVKTGVRSYAVKNLSGDVVDTIRANSSTQAKLLMEQLKERNPEKYIPGFNRRTAGPLTAPVGPQLGTQKVTNITFGPQKEKTFVGKGKTQMVDNPNIAQKELELGERLVPIEGIKELEGKLIPASTKSYIDANVRGAVNEEVRALLTRFDQVQAGFKAMVTTVFPSFHVRNFYSNVLQNYLDIGIIKALNPKTNSDAIKVMEGKNLDDVVRIGRQDWKVGDLRRLMQENGVLQKAAVFLDLEKPYNKGPLKYTGKVGNFIENQARAVNFLTNLEKTGSVMTAAEHAKKFLFDYGDLTKFEKTFMKRAFFFYTWPRKNIQLQIEQLLKNPGKFTKYGIINEHLNKGETEQDRALKPDYYKTKISPFLGRDQAGNPRYLGGIDLPFTSFLEQAGGPVQSTVKMVNPVVKVPAEMAMKYDATRGKKFEDLTDATSASYLDSAPTWLKDTVGYTSRPQVDPKTGEPTGTSTRQANPTILYLLRSLPTSRVSSVLNQISSDKKTSNEKWVNLLTGVRVDVNDLKKSSDIETSKYKSSLADPLVSRGLLYKSGGSYYMPKDVQFTEEEKALATQMSTILNNDNTLTSWYLQRIGADPKFVEAITPKGKESAVKMTPKLMAITMMIEGGNVAAAATNYSTRGTRIANSGGISTGTVTSGTGTGSGGGTVRLPKLTSLKAKGLGGTKVTLRKPKSVKLSKGKKAPKSRKKVSVKLKPLKVKYF